MFLGLCALVGDFGGVFFQLKIGFWPSEFASVRIV
jgi:hypothetical protein